MTNPEPPPPLGELSAESIIAQADQSRDSVDTATLYRGLLDAQSSQERTVEMLLRRVEALEGRSGRSDVPPPVNWARLDPNERQNAWQELGRFVEALVHRYELHREILPCWWRHGDVVEELGALRSAHQLAYTEGADAVQPSIWHDALERIRVRISGALSSCRDGHVEKELGTWMPAELKTQFHRMVDQSAPKPQQG